MTRLTDAQLDKAAAKDAVSSFVRVKARDWHRRQMNAVWPLIESQIDMALAQGHSVDIPALIRKVWLDHHLPELPE